MDSELPSYSGGPSSPSSGTTTAGPTTKPGFATRHALVHVISGKDTCTITLSSRAAAPGNPPLFYPGDVIDGAVELVVGKKLALKGVEVKFHGFAQMTAFAGIQDDMLQTAGVKESFTLLTAPLGSSSTAKTYEKGTHRIPFSLTIPRTFTWQGKEEYDIPPLFFRKGMPQSLAYNLEVNLLKKGFLSTNELYAHPLKIALPGQVERYSPLREAVYAEGATELVGPAEDPDGWELASGSAKGRLFDQEDVEVFLRLSLATPLSYPLDGYIPFILTFESSNQQALDLLSSPKSFALSLVGKLVFGTDVSRDTGKGVNESRDVIAKASFWAPSNKDQSEKGAASSFKTWHGEIRVPKDATIQFRFPAITLAYSVNLAISAPGFAPLSAPASSVFLSAPVTLGQSPPPGPPARSMFPAPSYSGSRP